MLITVVTILVIPVEEKTGMISVNRFVVISPILFLIPLDYLHRQGLDLSDLIYISTNLHQTLHF